MKSKTPYSRNWDYFYNDTYGKEAGNKALWDVPVEDAAALDFDLFSKFFDSDLPLIDIGCGLGHQTQFLATQYSAVWGIDVSEIAIDLARRRNKQANINFETIDMTEVLIENKKLAASNNIYMRGVLHQIKAKDRFIFQRNIYKLLGSSGRMYGIEVSKSIHTLFDKSKEFHGLPTKLRNAIFSKLPPEGMTVEQLEGHFPSDKFKIIKVGSASLKTNLKWPDGSAIDVPGVFFILSRRT